MATTKKASYDSEYLRSLLGERLTSFDHTPVLKKVVQDWRKTKPQPEAVTTDGTAE